MFIAGTCDVCDRDREIGAASLPFAPMSVAFCRECLSNDAYPLWSLHALIEMCGGVEQVAEWIHGVKAFKNDRYIDWDAIVACYKPLEDTPNG